MAGKAGKNFLLKMSDGAGTPAYAVIGGTRQVQYTIDAESIDVSSQDAPNWKELLSGSGQGGLKVSASGVSILNDAQEVAVRAVMLAGTVRSWKIVDTDDAVTLTCDFKVNSFEMSGEYKDAMQWSISLESSGTPVFS
jgi:TP901-1 family phage major tail protein